jgi:hypothetical protein
VLHGISVLFLWEDQKRAVCRAHVDKEMNGLTAQEQNGFDLDEEKIYCASRRYSFVVDATISL